MVWGDICHHLLRRLNEKGNDNMHHARNRLIHLLHIAGISRARVAEFLILDQTLEKAFTSNTSEISILLNIPTNKAAAMYKKIHHTSFNSNYQYRNARVKLITIYDEIYPIHLKNIHDPPLLLYCVGNLALFNHLPSISVIGTRKPTNEALQKTNTIISPLIKEGYLIVSGLAYGIDSIAHKLALQLKGKTISVLGGGFNHIYPRENVPLFKEIIEKGLVVSEYAPDMPPKKYHFPERNRIISGLSEGTLVIEATERSGTLITVDQALDQGKDVYAVPGSILNEQTVGCHRMIQDGAKLVMCAEDITRDRLA